jgi:hypothetical protein
LFIIFMGIYISKISSMMGGLLWNKEL